MNRAAKGIVAVVFASCALLAAGQGSAHQFPVYIQERGQAQKEAPKPAVKGIRIEDRITGTEARDPVRQGSFAKVHVVQLEAGDYQIDLMSNQFDCYLRLEDAQGNRIAENDDGGEGLNSRLFHRVNVPGTYRLIATTFAGGATGAYTLSVQERGQIVMPGKGGFGKKKVFVQPAPIER